MKQRILTLLQKTMQHELISGSFFLFLGTTVGNILAFVLNLFLVRKLSYIQYAEFSALMSLVTLAAIPAQSFLPTVVQFAGRYFAKNQTSQAKELFWQSSIAIGCIAFAFFVGFAVSAQFLGSFLHIKNTFEIILSGAVVGAIYLSITNTAFLQSLLKFGFLCFTVSLGGVLKLVVSVGFLLAGFGLTGVLWAYFLTFFLPYLLTFFPLHSLIQLQKEKNTIHQKEIFSYGLPAALAVFSLSSFTSTDILLVKHFFSPTSAALYSGISLVGRIIFYFSAPISSVMFPLVTKRFHQGENAQNLLYLSMLLVLLPSLVLTICYFVFPSLAIFLILGKHYLQAASYLGWFGLYLCIFSLLNVLVNFFLSIKKTNVSWIIVVGAFLQALGIFLFHATISVVVALSFILCLVLFVILLVYYIRLHETLQKAT